MPYDLLFDLPYHLFCDMIFDLLCDSPAICLRRIYEESKVETSIDMGFFLDYEKMKEKVVYKVIGYERNKELLSKIPHILFLDMALVFYCHAPQSGSTCVALISHTISHKSSAFLVPSSGSNITSCTELLMDRTEASDAFNAGSIPAGCITSL